MGSRVRAAVLAAALTAALALTGCAAEAPRTITGFEVDVALPVPATTANPFTAAATDADAALAAAIHAGFAGYDEQGQFVDDTSFGSQELISTEPFTVRYSIAPGVSWSDGAPVDAVDLLLNWAALSGALNTAGFDPAPLRDVATGRLDRLPAGTVHFDAAASFSATHGIRLASSLPQLSADRTALTVVFDSPPADWRTVLPGAGMPAHEIARQVFGIDDWPAAKESVLRAVQDADTAALRRIAQYWNTGFDLRPGAQPPGSGPFAIAEVDHAGSVRLVASAQYTGAHQPHAEAITLHAIADPRAAVQALHIGAIQLIATVESAEARRAVVDLKLRLLPADSPRHDRLVLRETGSLNGFVEQQAVREAFLLTVPRQRIVAELIEPVRPGAMVRSQQLTASGAAPVEQAAAFAQADVDAARALLADAGVASPELCLLYDPRNARHVAQFALIAESAAHAGIAVTDCSSEDWAARLAQPEQYDAALVESVLEVQDAAGVWDQLHSAGTGAIAASQDQQLDVALDRLLAAPEDRTEAAADLERVLWQRAAFLPIAQLPRTTAFEDRVLEGVSTSSGAAGVFWNLWQWRPVEVKP